MGLVLKRTVCAVFMGIASIALGVDRGNASAGSDYKMLSRAERQELQREIEMLLGPGAQLEQQGTRPLAELRTLIDGPVVIPITLGAGRGSSPANGAPLCFNVLILPNRVPGWVLNVNSVQGLWPPKVGPLHVFNGAIPAGAYFYWIFGWSGCASVLDLRYTWTQGAEFWAVFHRVVANVGPAGFNYPLIGPRWTIAAQSTAAANGSIGVLNAGASFCSQAYDLETGNCTGVPVNGVTVSFAGRMEPGQSQTPVPAVGGVVAAALAGALALFGWWRLRRAHPVVT